jgi:hypothetical protein
MKKKHAERKPSPLDVLTTTVAQDYAHRSTDEITRRRTVLACEASVIEAEIVALNAQMADAKARRARNDATQRGLMLVVEKR